MFQQIPGVKRRLNTMYCTEYSANFVWHENAYTIPKPHIRRKLSLEISRSLPQVSWMSSVVEQPKIRKDREKFKIIPAISKNTKCAKASVVRHFDLAEDARGLKSHFEPAIIESYVEKGINSYSKAQSMRNLYFTSVYAQDFTLSAITER